MALAAGTTRQPRRLSRRQARDAAATVGRLHIIVWPSVFEQQRRVILAARMLAVQGRIQREGEVVHLIAQRLHDLSGMLASVGERDTAFPLPYGRGDEFHHGSPSDDPRNLPPRGSRPFPKSRDLR